MAFSDGQRNLIRDCLRAYHQYTRKGNGQKQSWPNIEDSILKSTKVRIDSRNLKNFVNGVTTGKTRKFTKIEDNSLCAIIDFLSKYNDNWLPIDELYEAKLNKDMPETLLNYLHQLPESDRLIPTGKFEGRYQRRYVRGGHLIVEELILQPPLHNGQIEVAKIQASFDSYSDFEPGKSYACQMRKRSSAKSYIGWAIITPEDSLKFFLKDEYKLKNHYYISLAADYSFWTDDAIEKLFLLFYDFPMELEKSEINDKRVQDMLMEEISKSCNLFSRVSYTIDP